MVNILPVWQKYCTDQILILSCSTLEGYFVEDALQGQGIYTNEDGGILYGTYVDSELSGPAQEFDGEGCLVFQGQYKENNRCGECWLFNPVS